MQMSGLRTLSTQQRIALSPTPKPTPKREEIHKESNPEDPERVAVEEDDEEEEEEDEH
eukprot:gene8957-9786_t